MAQSGLPEIVCYTNLGGRFLLIAVNRPPTFSAQSLSVATTVFTSFATFHSVLGCLTLHMKINAPMVSSVRSP